ncbi:Asp23/Gls24 family envelope stress response protein [Nocardiopsis exhalans]|uniref:Asp23/Gls24 family envelope stress response protein n=1 Tax=Nocardiopsis exhalans TaxID=163604 RepID=A0ABY5DBC2_9ACTN|nr:Asp23/Gls24 family envelope stress response protein [Nocardiopsis exhalans]USY20368.1 Asp23/Gls24 family envelope stress response protein [Nocardiopsis exhalans]
MAAKNPGTARTDIHEAPAPATLDNSQSNGADAGSRTDIARTDRTPDRTDRATDNGRTDIADHVVAKIAGMAAREVRGVHQMGGGAARAFDAVRERIPGSTSTNTAARGVSVEVGQTQTAIDINLVVEYGISIPDLAGVVRRNVTTGVERMTGLEVTEVNVTVDDIHLPDDDSQDTPAEPRVR